jgi:hypothetical protein
MAETPPFARRVHIIPLGFEYARLRDPIEQWRADKVVAVEYSQSTADVPYLDELLDELEANDSVELEHRTCDIFDLYEALGVIAGAIDDHPDDDVYVNLSAGSKITAIAGMIACMATGAHPIYARPDYGPESGRVPEEPLHEAVAEIVELPTYPIERPSTLHVAHLAFIDERTDDDSATGRYLGVSKKELIAFGRDEGFGYIADSSASSRHGLYRLLDRHVIDPLLARGAIEIETVGRQSVVSLTPTGRNTLRAFRYVLGQSTSSEDVCEPGLVT